MNQGTHSTLSSFEHTTASGRQHLPLASEYAGNTELVARRQKSLGSDYSQDVTLDKHSTGTLSETLTSPRKVVKAFEFTSKRLGYNMTITETTRQPPTAVYYAEAHEILRNTPDIILHVGGSKDGDQIAVAHFRFSRHVIMGIGGDGLDSDSRTWEEMKNTSKYLGHSRYEFEYNVPVDTTSFSFEFGDNPTRERRQFLWERTRDEVDGVKGWNARLSLRNFKLVDRGSGQVLAVLLSKALASLKYMGKLLIHEHLHTEVEQLVILTAACILEKSERRMRRYSYGGCGGGP